VLLASSTISTFGAHARPISLHLIVNECAREWQLKVDSIAGDRIYFELIFFLQFSSGRLRLEENCKNTLARPTSSFFELNYEPALWH
jgi:hypothetical protein